MPSTFYLDIDLRSSRIFLAPYQQSKDYPYVIECESRWTAEALLKQLNARLVKSPREAPQDYQLKEVVSESLGQLEIFQLLRPPL